MTLGQLFSQAVPQFLHLENRGNKLYLSHHVVAQVIELKPVKHLEQGQTPSNHSASISGATNWEEDEEKEEKADESPTEAPTRITWSRGKVVLK